MSKPISEEELQLKIRARRRIIGAVTLVVLMVIFLPMIFDSQPKHATKELAVKSPEIEKSPSLSEATTEASQPNQNIEKPLPFKPVAIAEVKPFPSEEQIKLSEEEKKKVKPSPVESVITDKERAEKAQQHEKIKQAVKPNHENKESDTKQADKTEKKIGKFFVQVGVFSNPTNVAQIEEKLQESGVKHSKEKLRSPTGAVKVRAGPFASRNEAEAAAVQMKLAGVSNGVIVSE